MKHIVIILGLIILIKTSTTAQFQQAQTPTYVGIQANVLNYISASQRQNEWCWAASIQMVLNYYGISITQEQIAARTYGLDANGNIVNMGATSEIITRNLNNWNIDNSGRRYLVQAIYIPGPPRPSDLINQLTQGRLVVISYRNSTTPGHIIVLTACSYYPSQIGPNVQTLIFRDPWPNPQNIVNLGRVEYLANFANNITGCWFVSVQ